MNTNFTYNDSIVEWVDYQPFENVWSGSTDLLEVLINSNSINLIDIKMLLVYISVILTTGLLFYFFNIGIWKK